MNLSSKLEGQFVTNMSLAASGYSDAIQTPKGADCSLDLEWDDGTHVGTFSVVGSNFLDKADASWYALPLAPAITCANGSADCGSFSFRPNYRYIAIKYTRTSGTGTLTRAALAANRAV